MLLSVKFVKVISENDSLKKNTEPNEHYIGRRTSNAASISCFRVTMERILTEQSYRSKKFNYVPTSTSNFKGISLDDFNID